jgi:hypothetical protein
LRTVIVKVLLWVRRIKLREANSIELLVKEPLVFGPQQSKIIKTGVGSGRWDGVRGNVRMNGSHNALGFGKL